MQYDARREPYGYDMSSKKTFRLTDADVEALNIIMERDGISQTEAVRRAVHRLAADHTDAVRDNQPEKAIIDTLTSQLAAKDEQIAGLMTALTAAQETAKAAQALQAMSHRPWWQRLLGR